MTVRELLEQTTKTKLWFCPSIVHHVKFNSPAILRGYECSKSTVPEFLLDQQVTKHYVENNEECIFWNNTEQTEQYIRDTMEDEKTDE